MKYLLDTHTVIWALGEKEKLSIQAKSIIDNVSIPLCVSIVSAWEIAIKVSLKKINFVGGSRFFLEKMDRNGIEIIDLKGSYFKTIESLPFIHRDPFDRIIIATSINENLTIITHDENIQKYNVSWVW